MFPCDGPSRLAVATQPSQDEEGTQPEEEDALVLRMEAMMLAEAADQEEERFSFADSERFDEDDEEQFSAQASESSSFSHHWRGWAGRDQRGEINGIGLNAALLGPEPPLATTSGQVGLMPEMPSLKDLSARKVASALSFELIESTYARLPRAQKRLRPELSAGDQQQDYLPEQLVLLVLRHCFPESVENIRLYSCLTNCGDRLFALGEQLFQAGSVSELFQIGYHLSAVVQERLGTAEARSFDVCIRVDRCHIVSCSCSCSNASFWCQHAVAACLQRIQKPEAVGYRPAIWDSITSLRDQELKKLAQYLINELPREYIPVAQKLIDALKDPRSQINRTQGAPDPTAGPTDDTPAVWCMDERALHEEVRKTLVNFMRPSAMVCEVQSLLTSPPALAHEWSVLHRTLCAKQPESMWNLLGMVRVMLTRGDANGPALLHVLTEECLALDSVLLRWYQISLTASGLWHPLGPSGNGQRGNAQQSQSRQLNVFLLCQELAQLWQMVALNPRLSPEEREHLWALLELYQRTAVARVWAILGKMAGTENNMFGTMVSSQGHRLAQQNAPFARQFFPAFFPALQACRQLDWTNPEVQRMVQNMELGSRLAVDIQSAQRPCGRSPNLPFLRESPGRLFLLDLVEMEQQLGTSNAFNPDTVVLPPKSSKRRKKRRKGQQKRAAGSKSGEKEGKAGRKAREREEEEQRRRDSNELEQLSEVSSDEEQQQALLGKAGGSGGGQKQREPYEDALDALFAEAHAELDDPFSLRFTCCEALFCHGYFRESLQLAEQLAQELLANQPNLLMTNAIVGIGTGHGVDEDRQTMTDGLDSMSEENGGTGTGGSSFDTNGTAQMGGRVAKPQLPHSLRLQQFRRQFSAESIRRFDGGTGIAASAPYRARLCRSHPRLMAASLLTKETLWRTLFLAKLLLLGEQFMAKRRARRKPLAIAGPEPGHLRLRSLELALAAMRNCRGPAATKLLEMEINQLESELCALLHRLELCPIGLRIVRSLAQQYLAEHCQGKAPTSVTVPPTRMAHYVLNALSYSHHCRGVPKGQNAVEVLPPCQPDVFAHRQPEDDELALELALNVLGKDVHLSETDHPLLCECIRRHRKDLQMALLTRNRDCHEKLASVLGTVLDPKVHRMYEDHHRSNADFFSPSSHPSLAPSSNPAQKPCCSARPPPPMSALTSSSSSSSPSISPFQVMGGRVSLEGGSRRTSGEQSMELCSSSPGTARTAGPMERFPLYSTGPSLSVLANQASEAQAHHLFEFAKSLLHEAGGNQSSAMFNPMLVEGGGGQAGAVGFPGGAGANAGAGPAAGPHRNLHICSLLIALYALGLNNECQPSWNTRTYSTHVSWIQAQALDIGRQALETIRRTWRKHLTPTEVASLADKASQSADQATVEEAALLALSVLPEANSLLPAESQKALNQCKERSAKMLEEACLAVEKAAERGGVYPEVLFRVAHHWYDLYLAHLELDGPGVHFLPSCQPLHSPTSRWTMPQCQYVQQSGSYAYGAFQPPTANYSLLPTPNWPMPIGQMGQIGQAQLRFAVGPPVQSIGPSATTATPAFYSPSIPPPPLPPPSLAHGIPATNAVVAGCNSYRLQPSFSAPTLAGQQQQQQQAMQQMPSGVILPPPSLLASSAYGRMAPGQLVQLPQHHCLVAPSIQPMPLANAIVQISPPSTNLHRFQTAACHFQMGGMNRLDQHRPGVAGTARLMDERALQLLKNAHRVGIAAMNNLRSTECVSAKFAKNPPSCDEICWLLDVSLEIADPEYVRLFVEKAIACVGSPFVLLELLRGVLKFFQHLPNSHRVPGSGQLESILQTASGDLAKMCLQQAKTAMAQHSMAGPVMELGLHAVSAAFSAACHKLNFNSFNAPDQEYVCELALVTRDLFRLLPPYHEAGKRKCMELFMEHCGKQKCFKKFKSVQTAVQNALQQQAQQQRQQQQHGQQQHGQQQHGQQPNGQAEH